MRNYLCKLSGVAAMLAVSFGTVSARAQLVAYDSFSYADGTRMWGTVVGSGDGGTGWGSTWSATSAALSTNTSSGLSYGSLSVSGGGVVFGNPAGTTGTAAQSQRMLSGTLSGITGGAGTIWVSFLYQNWGSDQAGLAGFRETGLRLISGATINGNGSANVNGTDRLDAGTPNTYAVGASDKLSLFSGSTFVASTMTTPRGPNSANTVFVLMRLDYDNTTANDTAYAWFNPSLASEPSTATAISYTAADLTSINALRFQAGGQNASGTNAVWELDELRVGRGWADVSVVPEPTAILLSGLGGLALMRWRRRKQ